MTDFKSEFAGLLKSQEDIDTHLNGTMLLKSHYTTYSFDIGSQVWLDCNDSSICEVYLFLTCFCIVLFSAEVLPIFRMPKDKKKDDITELDHVDRNLSSLSGIPNLLQMTSLTRLTLSHNKLTSIPASIAELENLQVLTLWNNLIEELPSSISSLAKLRILNVGMNRLSLLPRGFGSFKSLEILDLTYNNLNERSLPGNFFFMESLRALYLGDNDFEMLPGDVQHLKNLQILVFRDNDLLSLPPELGSLSLLKELHLQGNRLSTLPPEIGKLDLIGPKQVLRLEHNPWVPSIQEQFDADGAQGVMQYLRSDNYKYLYGRQSLKNGPQTFGLVVMDGDVLVIVYSSGFPCLMKYCYGKDCEIADN
uniref:Leucine rich repeat containing 7 n=1 Tax=Heterorhabditis bacteriophora TaxID=37862 RepID=A0A1I7X6L2_HETBA